MYKIFFYDRMLGICNNWLLCSNQENAIIYKVIKKKGIKTIIRQFQQNQAMQELWLFTEEPDKIMDEVKTLFTVIEAAGGLVRNINNELLLIFRHDHWDLPKGKQESDETLPETALREVTEECGIAPLTLLDFYDCSYHIYEEAGDTILKKTYWYTMQYAGNTPLIPQEIEGIKQARWVSTTELPSYLPEMFLSMADLLRPVV
jgi:8-oxo-dGTP pyrophosphatase MutT (NUDIX family)